MEGFYRVLVRFTSKVMQIAASYSGKVFLKHSPLCSFAFFIVFIIISKDFNHKTFHEDFYNLKTILKDFQP